MKFRCAVADPPWKESGGGKSKRGADRHYPIMGLTDIIRTMQEPMSQVHEDAHMWLWVTDNFLRDGLAVMDTFGFRYVRTLQWVKMKNHPYASGGEIYAHEVAVDSLQIGLGQYLRGAHEMALLGVRGESMLPPTANRQPSVVFSERTKHSRKPDEAVRVFEMTSPWPRLEIFAREPRDGWTVWGNEV